MLRALIGRAAPYLIGGALIALAVLWLLLARANDRADRAEAEARAATIQASSNEAGQHIEARRSTNTRKAQQSAEEGRDAVQNATETDDVLNAWSTGVDRVRDAGKLPVSGPDGS